MLFLVILIISSQKEWINLNLEKRSMIKDGNATDLIISCCICCLCLYCCHCISLLKFLCTKHENRCHEYYVNALECLLSSVFGEEDYLFKKSCCLFIFFFFAIRVICFFNYFVLVIYGIHFFSEFASHIQKLVQLSVLTRTCSGYVLWCFYMEMTLIKNGLLTL